MSNDGSGPIEDIKPPEFLPPKIDELVSKFMKKAYRVWIWHEYEAGLAN